MNAVTDIEPADEAPSGQALATLENIDDICAGRDRAIELWIVAHRGFHASMKEVFSASIAGGIPSLSFSGHRHDNVGLDEAFGRSGMVEVWKSEGYDRKRVKVDAEDELRALVTTLIDRRCWTELAERLGIDQLFDRQAREEFHQGLAGTPPEFNAENVRATFETVWEGRRDMYLRGIANVFMALDRRFRSHDAFEIGNRVVFSYALADGGRYWNSRSARDSIADVERIFRELDGQPQANHSNSIVERLTGGPGRYEDEYFKADAFKNRNVHLWMKRKDLLAEVNKLLLEYYRPVEGDVAEGGPSYESGPLFHSTPAKHYGFFPSPEPVVAEVISRAQLYGREDCSGRAVDEWQPKRVLEPSAGTGAIALGAKAKGALVTCIEIQPHLAALCREHGFNTVQQDFFKVEPHSFEPFDYVLMNPPFDRGRDCDHVIHAMRFLKPGGVLVAVMSARAMFATDKRHAALHDLIAQNGGRWDRGREWSDLPERSFAAMGTNVNTVTLRIQKKASA